MYLPTQQFILSSPPRLSLDADSHLACLPDFHDIHVVCLFGHCCMGNGAASDCRPAVLPIVIVTMHRHSLPHPAPAGHRSPSPSMHPPAPVPPHNPRLRVLHCHCHITPSRSLSASDIGVRSTSLHWTCFPCFSLSASGVTGSSSLRTRTRLSPSPASASYAAKPMPVLAYYI